jgi:hypothetical protein
MSDRADTDRAPQVRILARLLHDLGTSRTLELDRLANSFLPLGNLLADLDFVDTIVANGEAAPKEGEEEGDTKNNERDGVVLEALEFPRKFFKGFTLSSISTVFTLLLDDTFRGNDERNTQD